MRGGRLVGVTAVAAVSLAAAVALVVTGLLPSRHAAVQGSDVGGPRVATAPSPAPSDHFSAAAQALLAPAAPPATLIIPAIGVSAPVESVGTDGLGRMATPSRPDHVAWFNPGAAPGGAGDAIIDGHLDWTSGPAVFWQLRKLHMGDQVIVVRSDGSRVTFVVYSTATVAFDARMDQLFATTGPPTLSLVTCSGSWDRGRGTYLQRLVVHAALLPATPQETPGDEGG